MEKQLDELKRIREGILGLKTFQIAQTQITRDILRELKNMNQRERLKELKNTEVIK